MQRSTKIDAGGWLSQAEKRLSHSETPDLEAQLVLASVLGKPRASVLAHPEQALDPWQVSQLETLLSQLEAGVPLGYVLGFKEFYGMEFKVSQVVLIPRPETELMVETAVEWLQIHPERRRVADVGTGSGCIAVVLAAQVPDLTVLAVDRSREALKVARENISRYGLTDRIPVVQSDLLTCFESHFDLVCANLPYIPTRTLKELAVARHEPIAALDGGADGLDQIRRLLMDAYRWMAPGGLLLLEIEAGQGETALALAEQTFQQADCSVKTDLAGRSRLLRIELASVNKT